MTAETFLLICINIMLLTTCVFSTSFQLVPPGIIVEMGYLSNSKDVIFLKDSKRPATAISKGIISYLLEQGYLTKTRNSIFR